MLEFRKAKISDIEKVSKIYSDIHMEEERGILTIGWKRGVYPVLKTAEDACLRDDLFVLDVDGEIVGSAIINKNQVSEYSLGNWEYDANVDEVMVLHTLVISPKESGKGYGRLFVDFYERYALSKNCPYLRMDTNEKNKKARAMYKKLGYKEIGIVPCVFNGIKNVGLVLLEKNLITE